MRTRGTLASTTFFLLLLTLLELLAGRAAGMSQHVLMLALLLLAAAKGVLLAVDFMRLREEPRLILAIVTVPLVLSVGFIAGLVVLETWGRA